MYNLYAFIFNYFVLIFKNENDNQHEVINEKLCTSTC